MKSKRLTLQDLVDLLADEQNITKKDSETFLRELISLISETIEEKDFVRIKDFGTFKLTSVNARRSVDVNTGDPIEIPAHYKLSFTPEKTLREGVNKPFSHFESILLEDEVAFEDKAKADKRAKANKIEEKVAEERKQEQTPEIKEEEPKVTFKTVVPSGEKKEETKKETAQEIVLETTSIKEKKSVVIEEDIEKINKISDLNDFLEQGVEEKKLKKKKEIRKELEHPSAEKMSNKYDDDDDDYYGIQLEREKKRNKNLILLALGAVLIGAVIWAYVGLFSEPETIPYVQDNSQITITGEVETESSEQPKSGNELTGDETKTPIAEKENIVEQPTVVVPKGETIVVKAGQTMRELGKQYYGHISFWVYIFEENKEKIKRPDDVFAGMELVIPAASKYGIDANDRASVRKARQQEMKLFGEFNKE